MGNNNDKSNKGSCGICSVINVEPVEMKKNGDRLLTVRIEVTNICYDKKVAVDCIIFDQNHRIIAYRSFISIVCKEYGCTKDECKDYGCGTIERKIVFILPCNDICCHLELEVEAAANYIY